MIHKSLKQYITYIIHVIVSKKQCGHHIYILQYKVQCLKNAPNLGNYSFVKHGPTFVIFGIDLDYIISTL